MLDQRLGGLRLAFLGSLRFCPGFDSALLPGERLGPQRRHPWRPWLVAHRVGQRTPHLREVIVMGGAPRGDGLVDDRAARRGPEPGRTGAGKVIEAVEHLAEQTQGFRVGDVRDVLDQDVTSHCRASGVERIPRLGDRAGPGLIVANAHPSSEPHRSGSAPPQRDEQRVPVHTAYQKAPSCYGY